MSELRFDGRVAVITGGARGLGKAYAELLAARGCKLVINDIGASMHGDDVSTGPAEELAAHIRANGGDAVASTDSVATPEGGQAIIQTAIDAFGRIDILIHSAGNVRKALIRDMSFEDFEAVLDVHLRGAFHVVKAAHPLMCDQGYGRIILTGSINGLYGKKLSVNYGTAKAGLVGLSHTAAVEGAEFGVTSNVIAPVAVTRMSAGIDTSQFPPMEPEMVAPLVAWLAHESCTVSGEMLIAAGGRMARAFLAESPGAFQKAWTVEDVAARAGQIRDTADPVIFAPVPKGELDHLLYGFAMARDAQG
jgi:NAD(P)-dependent dehydrogenase (short-subunit alcohol dehydrogenase family)